MTRVSSNKSRLLHQLLCAALAVAVAGCGAGTSGGAPPPPTTADALFSDPMADAKVDGARRIERKLTVGTLGDHTEKPRPSRVSQTFQTSAPSEAVRVRDVLRDRALGAGWVATAASTPKVFSADKVIDGAPSGLDVFVDTGNPNKVVLLLSRSISAKPEG